MMLNTLMLVCLIVKGVTSVTQAAGWQPNDMNPNFSGELEDIEFRVAVEPSQKQCFYQEAKVDHRLEINYQVIEITSNSRWIYTPRGSRDLTIDFRLTDPNGKELINEYNKQDGSHLYAVQVPGVYVLCLDNSFSSTSAKLVNVEIYMYSEADRWGGYSVTFPPEIQYLDSVDNIKTTMNKVRDSLTQVTHSQDERRAIERRDRNIIESNYDYVNKFSIISLFIMIVVGLTQIFMIRSLFEEKSVIKKIFKQF